MNRPDVDYLTKTPYTPVALIEWLRSQNAILPLGSKAYTHLSLSGGIYNIPDDRMDDFFKSYAADVCRKKYGYFVECRTPVYKLHFDIDLVEPNTPELVHVHERQADIRDLLKHHEELGALQKRVAEMTETTDSQTRETTTLERQKLCSKIVEISAKLDGHALDALDALNALNASDVIDVIATVPKRQAELIEWKKREAELVDVQNRQCSEYIQKIIPILVNTVKTFYSDSTPADTFEVLLLAAPAKGVSGADKKWPCQKVGLHPIFYNLNVTVEMGLLMRASCIAELRRLLGARESPRNSWEDAIDRCVFDQNGLRMVFSMKGSKCKCRSRKGCGSCVSGTVTEKRAYTLMDVLDSSGTRKESLFNSMQVTIPAIPLDENAPVEKGLWERATRLVRLASVRTVKDTPVTPGFVRPAGAPSDSTKASTAKAQKQHVRDVMGFQRSDPPFAEDDRASSKLPMNELARGELFDMIQAFIHSAKDVYSKVEVSKITHSEDRRVFFCKVRGFGSSYCLNVRRDHNQNTIYFMINEEGVHQMCFSRKEKPVNGQCASACGKWKCFLRGLTEELKHALFDSHKSAATRFEENRMRATSSLISSAEFRPDVGLLAMQAGIEEHMTQLTIRKDKVIESQVAKANAPERTFFERTHKNIGDKPHDVFSDISWRQFEDLSMRECNVKEQQIGEKCMTKSEKLRREAFGISDAANDKMQKRKSMALAADKKNGAKKKRPAKRWKPSTKVDSDSLAVF